MSGTMRTILMAGAIVAVVSTGRAQAQVEETLKFTTSFPFTAGHSTFPAGSYTVRPLGTGTDVMEISNGASTRFINVQAAGAKAPSKIGDEVIFKKQGDGYVLSEIWDSAEQAGVEPMSLSQPVERHQHHHQS